MLDTSDPVILNCLRFPFANLILHGSNRTKEEKGIHIISNSRNWGQSERPPCMYVSFA